MQMSDVREIMRLSSVWAIKRVRRFAVSNNLGHSHETRSELERQTDQAEHELRVYLEGRVNKTAEVSNNWSQAIDVAAIKVYKAERQQEIISYIAFNLGLAWRHRLDVPTQKSIMDNLDGSPGLMDRVIESARKFDEFWEALPEHDERRENYIGEVSNWADKLLEELLKEVGQ